jgi:copper chaperone CopZ
MATAIYAVAGLTCGDCMAAVLDNVRTLPGVTDAVMDLVTGGHSPLIVVSGTKLGSDALRAAVENAGQDLADAERRDGRRRGDGLSIKFGDSRPSRERMMSASGGVRS